MASLVSCSHQFSHHRSADNSSPVQEEPSSVLALDGPPFVQLFPSFVRRGLGTASGMSGVRRKSLTSFSKAALLAASSAILFFVASKVLPLLLFCSFQGAPFLLAAHMCYSYLSRCSQMSALPKGVFRVSADGALSVCREFWSLSKSKYSRVCAAQSLGHLSCSDMDLWSL